MLESRINTPKHFHSACSIPAPTVTLENQTFIPKTHLLLKLVLQVPLYILIDGYLYPKEEEGEKKQGRAGQGRAGAARLAKPSHRVCTTPKLVVFEAVIYPNKEKQWLRRASHGSDF